MLIEVGTEHAANRVVCRARESGVEAGVSIDEKNFVVAEQAELNRRALGVFLEGPIDVIGYGVIVNILIRDIHFVRSNVQRVKNTVSVDVCIPFHKSSVDVINSIIPNSIAVGIPGSINP